MSDIVESLYQTFERTCRTYLPTPACQRLHHAYLFAQEAHGDQRRKSGEPYITHPITVAHYMAQHYMDESILTGALLHDVAEDTHRTLDDIEAHFGKQTRHLVDGVTHLANVSQLEDIAHLFLAMSSDVRVVLIKLYDRLHNLKTLDCMPPERKRRKALETLNIYVPLAGKLGLWQLKTEFETLILYHLDPRAYHLITAGLEEQARYHKPHLEAIGKQLQDMLRTHGIVASFRLKTRSPYRIYEKMAGSQLDVDAFSQAFQIIIQVDSLADCYLTLGYIHKHFPHITGSLADTIGNPRDIFYRSLHTTIIPASDYKTPVHLRIRTYEFDRQSEIGIMTQLQFVPSHEAKQPENAPWLPQLPQLYSEAENAQKFVENVFQDILQKHILCFTPRGDELSLPRGATVLDFAYYVHTDIGHECRGAIINGESVELSRKLSDGDHVEIIRARRALPMHEWLDDTLGYAVTARARNKIRDWFRRQQHDTLIRIGKEALREERRRLNALRVSAYALARIFQLEDASTLYLKIGSGDIPISEIARAMIRLTPDTFAETSQKYLEIHDDLGQKGWLRRIGDHQLQLAKCCQPHIGEAVVGHVHEGRHMAMLHRTNCHYIIRSRRTETLIRMEWLPSDEPLLVAYIRLEGYDRGGLLRDISIPIAKLGGNIMQLDSVITDRKVIIRLKVELLTVDDLIRVIHRLATLQNITQVQRMNIDEIQLWNANLTASVGK